MKLRKMNTDEPDRLANSVTSNGKEYRPALMAAQCQGFQSGFAALDIDHPSSRVAMYNE